ncbi:hypothetical protein [Pseudomonas putida]|uniref:hypothetical protein n=1 Tax=Pseudomonas putida TaxID=303 RepID=UPI000CB65183|nr:hypothetical protein [Pseudomonas putida]PNG87240.1 hypothetical protein CBL13_01098 [Pseudomonas putida]
MAGKKSPSKATETSETIFKETALLPSYTNNARIKVTSDNVFIDFGFVDPFNNTNSNESEIIGRVVMNRSTFETFSKHLNITQTTIQQEGEAPDVPVVIMSRCPPKSGNEM